MKKKGAFSGEIGRIGNSFYAWLLLPSLPGTPSGPFRGVRPDTQPQGSLLWRSATYGVMEFFLVGLVSLKFSASKGWMSKCEQDLPLSVMGTLQLPFRGSPALNPGTSSPCETTRWIPNQEDIGPRLSALQVECYPRSRTSHAVLRKFTSQIVLSMLDRI